MVTESRVGPARATTVLRAPKRTGTHGDTLIGWGLALLASDVLRRDVTLRNTSGAFEIELPGTTEQLAIACRTFVPSANAMLPWLASTEKGRQPGTSITYSVDRDRLRDDYAGLREAGQRPAASGDAPAVSAHPLALRYSLFQVLTNPGTQWSGYNSVVERAQAFWTPEGVESLIMAFLGTSSGEFHDEALMTAMQAIRLRPADRRVNPPGFLFPGSNKGPTMRINRSGVITGQATALDWMMADRNDVSLAELYLAYLGYYGVAVVHSFRGGRVVSVPAPEVARVGRALRFLSRVQPRSFPASPAAAAADAALSYAEAALEYHADLIVGQPSGPSIRRSLVINGVHLAVYWMPSGNTYAPQQITFVPLPRWLVSLSEQAGFDNTRATLREHRQRVRTAGRAEGGEAREAIQAYRMALSGDALAWLRVIPAWYQAALAEQYVGSWRVGEVERIVMALQPDLSEITRDPAFESITGALRRSTIEAHYAREGRRTERAAGRDGAVLSERPGSPLSAQYDLIGALRESAARHPDEFLRELFDFIAAYNDEAMRRDARIIRTEDIEQLIAWMRDDRRGLVPALVIAFGVSLPRRARDTPADETEPELGANPDEGTCGGDTEG
jgi:hypothetical protein